MGVRYNKRIKINDWLNINIGKSGPTLSVGPKGAKVNIGPKGANVNAGIPGTGVSYRKKIGSTSTNGSRRSKKQDSNTKAYWLLIIAAGLIYVGQTYEQFATLTYVGVGVALLYLAVLYFKRKRTTDGASRHPREENGTSQLPREENSVSRLPREESTAPPFLSESQREQLRDRMANCAELQPLNPHFIDAAKVVVHFQEATPALLKEKLQIDAATASTLLRQLELIGIVGMERTDGTRALLVKNDSQLAEIFEAVVS